MPCLDTNILVGLLRGDPDAGAKIQSLEDKGLRITTTVINACELYRGAQRSSKAEENLEVLEELLRNIEMLDLNLKAAKTAASILEEQKAGGKTVNEMDALIAAIALTNNETLVTRDKDFKRIKELRMEIW
ncbi:MAG: type II toxin-antitoxin system VapC family toxin [Candidatus Altiarchaeota archaeon]|nr:type II toxin-antitoxin system VapC family toxin [Candidatus Altiarchaeota archaeon]